jgi:hypothetical protein
MTKFIKAKRVGGIYFVSIGRVQFSFCVKRKEKKKKMLTLPSNL